VRGESCRWYCGQHSREIDYDNGDRIDIVDCVQQVFATPDVCETCERYEANRGDLCHED